MTLRPKVSLCKLLSPLIRKGKRVPNTEKPRNVCTTFQGKTRTPQRTIIPRWSYNSKTKKTKMEENASLDYFFSMPFFANIMESKPYAGFAWQAISSFTGSDWACTKNCYIYFVRLPHVCSRTLLHGKSVPFPSQLRCNFCPSQSFPSRMQRYSLFLSSVPPAGACSPELRGHPLETWSCCCKSSFFLSKNGTTAHIPNI